MDSIYPLGRRMLFTGYSPVDTEFERLKDNHFTALGPIYGSNFDEHLAKCEKIGIKCVYSIQPSSADGTPYTMEMIEHKNFDFSKLRKQVTAIVKKHSLNPNIAIWNVMPENLKYWDKNDMKYLQIVTKAIHDTDMLKRPIMIYSTYNRDGAGILKELEAAPALNTIAHGCYPNYTGNKHERIRVKWTLEQDVQAALLAKTSAFPLLITEMFQKVENDKEVSRIPKWVRHDVYCGLVNGAKGIVIFSLSPRAGLPYEEYLEPYIRCATELDGENGLGQVFLFGIRRNYIEARQTLGPKRVSCKLPMDKKYSASPLSFAEIAYDGKIYLFAVNSAEKNIEVKFTGLPKDVIINELLEGSAYDSFKNGNLTITLPGLGVKAFSFEQDTKRKKDLSMKRRP